MFTLTPLDHQQRYFLPDADHITVGLSPWNGRYKPRYIEDLVTWVYRRCGKVDVFVPGYEAAHTQAAAGRPVREAVHLARRAINQLRNPALRALEAVGASDPEQHVQSWTQLHNRTAYASCLKQVRAAYREDPEVRAACRATAHAVITHLRDDAEITDHDIDLAVGYALAELPLVLHGPLVYGVKSSMFLYHREMELLYPFFRKDAPLSPAPGQGYAIVTPLGEQA